MQSFYITFKLSIYHIDLLFLKYILVTFDQSFIFYNLCHPLRLPIITFNYLFEMKFRKMFFTFNISTFLWIEVLLNVVPIITRNILLYTFCICFRVILHVFCVRMYTRIVGFLQSVNRRKDENPFSLIFSRFPQI